MKDITNNIFDPTQVHRKLVANMEERLGLQLRDPTSTFVMMLESIGESNTETMQHTATMMRDIHPTTAISYEGLMRHATSEELIGMKANPSSTTMTIFLNAIDITSNGTISNLGDIIPGDGVAVLSRVVKMSSGTKIIVDGVVFSTTTDIRIHYDGTNSIVEQMIDVDDTINGNRVGSINSFVVTDGGGGKWIRFDINVRQFDHYKVTRDVIGVFRKIIPYDDYIWYVGATGLFDDGERELELTYSDINYDRSTPTLKLIDTYTEQHGKHLIVELPNIYRINNAPKRIEIQLHTTKGKLDKRLVEFNISDFEVVKNIGDYELTNVTIQVLSTGVVNGGTTPKTMNQIRESIVNNVTGPIKAPVTKLQLEEKASRDGFSIDLYSDMITHRLFTVSKNVATSLFTGDEVVPNIFLNETHLNPDITNFGISYTNGSVVVRNETMFITKNGLTTPATNIGLLNTYLQVGGYDNDGLTSYLATNNIFFTPYTNIIHDDYICNTYDLHSPEIDSITITNRNVLPLIVNIGNMSIKTVKDEFHIELELFGLGTVDLTQTEVRVQLVIDPHVSGNSASNGSRMYFDNIAPITTDNAITNLIIPMRSYVDKLDKLMLYGEGNTTPTFVDLRTEAKLYIYIPEDLNMTTIPYPQSLEIRKPVDVVEVTALTTQSLRINFGNKLDNLFNETSFGFTSRKYKKHLHDIPYFHDSDVYAVDEDCSSGDPLRLIHAKSSIKTDTDGNTLYRVKAGDTILENGRPVVDTLNGIMVKSNLIMFEFEYLISKSRRYRDTIQLLKDNVKQFLNYCDIIGENRLESTNFKYKPNMVSSYVLVEINGKIRTLPQSIRPKIKLYIDKNTNFELDTIEIGKIIHDNLYQDVVRLDFIRNQLIDTLGVRTVSMNDLGIGIESEYIKMIRNQFTLAKKLTLDKKIVYDIEIEIERV